MEAGRKPRKRDRLAALLKRNEKRPQTPPQIASDEGSSPASNKESGDRQRTKARYIEATKSLEEVIKGCRSQWGSFDFPELRGEPENPNDSQFKHKINMILDAQKSGIKDQSAWEKCKHTIQCVFSALSPFAKNFLMIVTQGQPVPSRVLQF
jgi:hypothetical protein